MKFSVAMKGAVGMLAVFGPGAVSAMDLQRQETGAEPGQGGGCGCQEYLTGPEGPLRKEKREQYWQNAGACLGGTRDILQCGQGGCIRQAVTGCFQQLCGPQKVADKQGQDGVLRREVTLATSTPQDATQSFAAPPQLGNELELEGLERIKTITEHTPRDEEPEVYLAGPDDFGNGSPVSRSGSPAKLRGGSALASRSKSA